MAMTLTFFAAGSMRSTFGLTNRPGFISFCPHWLYSLHSLHATWYETCTLLSSVGVFLCVEPAILDRDCSVFTMMYSSLSIYGYWVHFSMVSWIINCTRFALIPSCFGICSVTLCPASLAFLCCLLRTHDYGWVHVFHPDMCHCLLWKQMTSQRIECNINTYPLDIFCDTRQIAIANCLCQRHSILELREWQDRCWCQTKFEIEAHCALDFDLFGRYYAYKQASSVIDVFRPLRCQARMGPCMDEFI